MYDRLNNLYDVLKLSSKNILLVGVGGVGASAFEVLIRSGIKNITIVDFDVYEKSNLNRQLGSSLNTIGQKKVDVLFKHAKDINPDINVTVLDEFLEEGSLLDLSKYDYIIDACDSVPAKVMLITKANELNIPIVVSLGIGNRVNPGNLGIFKLSNVNGDPLGKKLRNKLKMINFNKDVICVASKEVPIKSNPVNSYIGVTLYAGILLADKVIKDLL